MSYHLDPDNDPSEAYAVIPIPSELRGTSDYWTGWWTVTRNGAPVRYYPPKDRDLAERFATDPACRQQLTNKKRRRLSDDEKGVLDLDTLGGKASAFPKHENSMPPLNPNV